MHTFIHPRTFVRREHRPCRVLYRIALLLNVLCSVTALPTSASAANQEVSPTSGGDTRVIEHAGYDYAPSIMWDEGKYKMWWCTDNADTGDRIWYAESTNLTTWTNQQEVFFGTGQPDTGTNCNNGSNFDCTDTCDPSVVKVNGTYYLYYGGFPVHANPSIQNRVGLATSSTGTGGWTRQNGGNPILVGKYSGGYGAGHPSVIFLGGMYYMTYTDTSVGDGQYAIRSSDPTFPQSNYDELTSTGWVHRTSGAPVRGFEFTENAQNVDWAYLDSLRQFVMAIDGRDDTPKPGAKDTRWVSLRFFDQTLMSEVHDQVDIDATWLEGPGLAKYSNGHALHSNTCHKAYTPIMRASDMEGSGSHYTDCWNNTFVTAPALTWFSCWEMGLVAWEYANGLTSCPDEPLDYDGDSMSDATVYRGSTNSFYTKKSSSVATTIAFGASGATPITGDFDGDGIADAAYVVPNGGYVDWHITKSSDGTTWDQPTWGLTTDQIVVADYTNDGKDDLALFRNGGWYIMYDQAGNNYTASYGTTGDIPVPADYDGDHIIETAVWRPSNGYWYFTPSSTGSPVGIQWGAGGDIPFSGKFFHSDRSDIIVWRPTGTFTGYWFIRSVLTGGNTSIQWGLNGDKPIATDFDSDGKMDLTVYRPSTQNWYINLNGSGTTQTIAWGSSGDLIPSRRP